MFSTKLLTDRQLIYHHCLMKKKDIFIRDNALKIVYCVHFDDYTVEFLGNPIPVKLPWIFPGAPLNFNGAPGNIQGNLTGK